MDAVIREESPRQPHEQPFSVERIRRLAQIERRHFWFVGRRALILRLLSLYCRHGAALVLDAGCGTGSMVELLAQMGVRVAGFDLRPEGLMATKRACQSAWFFQAESACLPIADGMFDAALALDVLEHVDDRTMLAEITRVLRPGAGLVLTVPALPSLWSYRDEAAGHLRRYTKRHLEGLLNEAPLEICEVGYYQCLLLPLVIATRWLGRRNSSWRDMEDLPAPLVNYLLTLINRTEVSLGRFLTWPCGSSLFAVCRKQELQSRVARGPMRT
jgi:SAM-dependent methyltransferase